LIFDYFLGRKNQAQKENKKAITDQKIDAIQKGDHNLRNDLIRDYQPFIIKISSKVCKRYIDPNKDDEFSIALSAFNEAMDAYDFKKDASFLTFSEVVIKRRLIDYIRKESRYQRQIPMTAFDVENDEEQSINPVEMNEAINQYTHEETVKYRKEEIIQFTEELAKFGISIEDLVKESPKHKDARYNILQVVDSFINEPDLIDYLLQKKIIPIKQLLPLVSVSRKTIERNRKYIIALVVIYTNEFYYLKEYLHIVE